MSEARDITITLTDAQIARVVLEASGRSQLAGSLAEIGTLDDLRRITLPLLSDERYSHTTFRAAMVLAAFPADGSETELSDVATMIGLPPSTTYRYARTWTVLGLLEQNPDTRRYRRVHVNDATPKPPRQRRRRQ